MLAPWADRVDRAVAPEAFTSARADDRADAQGGAQALLVRPDGYVCWVGQDAADQPQAALRTWFGDPCELPLPSSRR